MLFKKSKPVPEEVKAAGLDGWYNDLDDQNKMKLSRYIAGSKNDSAYSFFKDVILKALADENYAFAVFMCQEAYDFEMDDYQRFTVNELLIDGYIGMERYDDAKAACEANFDLYDKVKDKVLADNNGKVPEKLNFRNRYIDVIVGIDSNYDLGFEMLEKYNNMGILSDEDLVFRRESLKTRRLQKLFDSVYTYRPVEKEL